MFFLLCTIFLCYLGAAWKIYYFRKVMRQAGFTSNILMVYYYVLITGRNEVVAKVMFLQVCVCPQGGGGCLPQCMLGCHTPPPDGGKAPPGWRTPPGPGRTPPGWRTPPGPGRPPNPPPPRKQTPAYGLRAAGTHPTGMHSCN